jgi:hypothetical protein
MVTHVGLLERGYMTRMFDYSRHLANSNVNHHLERRLAIYQASQLGLGGKPGGSSVQVSLKVD